MLIATRRKTDGFSSSDCESLQQLTEHVALATHQAQMHAALQQTYDDLRQTQHTVMQQERPRALAQMASDDPLVTKSLRDTLEADGHMVTTTNSGQEGIHVFRATEGSSERFAIVVADLGMPYIDGRKLRAPLRPLPRPRL